jgi:hypothetical protein
MVGSDQRYSEPCPTCKLVERVASSRRWIDLLPPDIARKVAIDNPVRIYHLTLNR